MFKKDKRKRVEKGGEKVSNFSGIKGICKSEFKIFNKYLSGRLYASPNSTSQCLPVLGASAIG